MEMLNDELPDQSSWGKGMISGLWRGSGIIAVSLQQAIRQQEKDALAAFDVISADDMVMRRKADAVVGTLEFTGSVDHLAPTHPCAPG